MPYFTDAELRNDRGWTVPLIVNRLGLPDFTVPNTDGSLSLIGMYEANRVLEQETVPAVANKIALTMAELPNDKLIEAGFAKMNSGTLSV